MKRVIFTLAILSILTTASAQRNGKVLSRQDSISYAYGILMFENAKSIGFSEINYDLVMKAIEDAQKGSTLLDLEKSNAVVNDEVKKIQNKKSEEARRQGEEFLLKNKNRPGVITTSTGLQYEIIRAGSGISPDKNDKVRVHYHGTLVDGTVFDSSVERNKDIEFGLNQVISGWTEGLQYMNEGAKFRFYIPQNLGYGSRAQGKIPAYSTLIFDVELFEVKKID
jgi:FKBP-type peptidyl-prolyl cis-trans isomerase FklB